MKYVFVIFLFTISIGYKSSAQLIFLLQEENPLTVPFEYKGDLILVDVVLEQKLPLKFILDTGAENCVLFNKDVSDLLGLKAQNKVVLRGSNLQDTIVAHVMRRVNLKLDNLNNTQTDILVLEHEPKNLSALVGEQVHGILGASFFSNFVLEVNSKRNVLRFYTTTSWTQRNLKKFDTAPLIIKDGKPYIETEVTIGEEKSKLKLLLDSGAAIFLLMHHNTFENLKLPENKLEGIIGSGISGDVMGYLARVNHFNFGHVDFNERISSFQTFEIKNLEDNGIIRNGIVGNQLMSRYHWAIDYSQRTFYSKPYKEVKKDFSVDKSGLSLIASGVEFNEFQIYEVRSNSPAGECGIQAGDKILKIQGIKSQYYNLHRINKLLSGKTGKKIRILIQRGEEIRKFRFSLKDLL